MNRKLRTGAKKVKAKSLDSANDMGKKAKVKGKGKRKKGY